MDSWCCQTCHPTTQHRHCFYALTAARAAAAPLSPPRHFTPALRSPLCRPDSSITALGPTSDPASSSGAPAAVANRGAGCSLSTCRQQHGRTHTHTLTNSSAWQLNMPAFTSHSSSAGVAWSLAAHLSVPVLHSQCASFSQPFNNNKTYLLHVNVGCCCCCWLQAAASVVCLLSFLEGLCKSICSLL